MLYLHVMTKFSRDDVLKLARLARLSLSEAEAESFSKEISEILSYVEKLQSADVSGLEPTIQVTGLSNVMREDSVQQYQAKPEDLLKNAPSVQGTSIRVKRVIK